MALCDLRPDFGGRRLRAIKVPSKGELLVICIRRAANDVPNLICNFTREGESG